MTLETLIGKLESLSTVFTEDMRVIGENVKKTWIEGFGAVDWMIATEDFHGPFDIDKKYENPDTDSEEHQKEREEFYDHCYHVHWNDSVKIQYMQLLDNMRDGLYNYSEIQKIIEHFDNLKNIDMLIHEMSNRIGKYVTEFDEMVSAYDERYYINEETQTAMENGNLIWIPQDGEMSYEALFSALLYLTGYRYGKGDYYFNNRHLGTDTYDGLILALLEQIESVK